MPQQELNAHQRIRQLLDENISMAADIIVQKLKEENYKLDHQSIKDKIYKLRSAMKNSKYAQIIPKNKNPKVVIQNIPVNNVPKVIIPPNNDNFNPNVNEVLGNFVKVNDIVMKLGGIEQFNKLLNTFDVISSEQLSLIVSLYQQKPQELGKIISALETLVADLK